MRYALYYTPVPGSLLDGFGNAAIGYNSATSKDVPRLVLPGVDPERARAITAEPRRYGFHATLKAPMRLHEGRTEEELVSALEAFAASGAPVEIGRLEVQALGRFLALVPENPPAELALLAAECVAAFDRFRAPLAPDDRARRLAAGLSGRQIALLDRWGYPHVFERFRFHMTLTGALPDERERRAWLEGLRAAHAGCAGEVVTLDAISLLRQSEPDGRFRLIKRLPLHGAFLRQEAQR
jgi:putative phosphonate metabolism protein